MARLFAAVVILVAVLPALASEPGQPLDCSDWVFLKPGLSCSALSCGGGDNYNWCNEGTSPVIDNEGHMIRKLVVPITGHSCSPFELTERRIIQFDGHTEEIVGYVRDRCVAPGVVDQFFWQSTGLVFDPTTGRLYVGAYTASGGWLMMISGFATTFDILQTYTPQSNTIGFRVPVMPEGFPAADHFDTYYGTLSTVGDWSQAQPLQCGYPASPPHVGDYLTVNDPLPNPVSGRGRYYVTAATYQGQTRYGRKGTRGVLSGRDPTALPPCIQPESHDASRRSGPRGTAR